MNKEFSPEERLLHLIKGKKDIPKKPEKQQEEKPIIKDETITLKEKSSTPIKEINKEPIKTITKSESKSVINSNVVLLIVVFVILLAMGIGIISIFTKKEDKDIKNLELLISSISEAANKKPLMDKEPTEKLVAKDQVSKKEGTSSFADYQKLLSDKSIFAPAAPRKRQQLASEGPSLRDLVKELRLVGIMPGEDPQAIIEDKRSGQTLFLRKGEMINDIKIEVIGTGRVTLGYGEDTTTLSL